MRRAALAAALAWSIPVYADYQMVITIKLGDDMQFQTVDKPWEHEHQCLMVLNQYKLGAAKKAIPVEMTGGGCLDCAEFPEFCGKGI